MFDQLFTTPRGLTPQQNGPLAEERRRFANLTERAWITLLAAQNPMLVESMQRTAAEMRSEIAGEHPTRLERLLVDQVISCWLEAKYVECLVATPSSGPVQQAGYWLKRLESAQKRHTNAIKTLAVVRSQLSRNLAPAGAIKLYNDGKQQRA